VFEGSTLDPSCQGRTALPRHRLHGARVLVSVRLHYLRSGGRRHREPRGCCTFDAKRDGVMLIIDGDDGVLSTETWIDHNLFAASRRQCAAAWKRSA
jgi:hypothetical protein